jgi:hypothetical protein
MNKFKIIPEIILLLPNSDCHEQDREYGKGCSTFTKHWPPWTSSRLLQMLYYFSFLCTDQVGDGPYDIYTMALENFRFTVWWLRYPHLLCGIWIQRTNIQIGSSWISVVVSCCPRMISSPMWKIQTKDYRMVIFASHYTCII